MNKSTDWIQPSWRTCFFPNAALRWGLPIAVPLLLASKYGIGQGLGYLETEHAVLADNTVFLRQCWQNWIALILSKPVALQMWSKNPQGLRDSFTGLMRSSLFQFHTSMKLNSFFIYSTKTTYWSILNTEADRRLQMSFKLDICEYFKKGKQCHSQFFAFLENIDVLNVTCITYF